MCTAYLCITKSIYDEIKHKLRFVCFIIDPFKSLCKIIGVSGWLWVVSLRDLLAEKDGRKEMNINKQGELKKKEKFRSS